jgi:hypothetical protein
MAITDYLTGIDRYTSGPKADVSNAAKDLATLQEGQGSLPAKLKEALNTKLNNNRDIIDQQSQTMQNYFNSGAQAREKYQDVFNPFEKAKLVQQDRSMALRPYDTLSGVLENRMGSVADIVNAGVQGWQGLVNAAGTKAELAKSNLATALQSYFGASQQQQAADDMAFKIAQAEEAARQFNQTYGLESRKVDVNESQFAQEMASRLKIAGMSSGGGGGGINWGTALGGLITGDAPGQTSMPTEQKPVTNSAQAQRMASKPFIQWKSPGGQWMWDPETKDWYPISD